MKKLNLLAKTIKAESIKAANKTQEVSTEDFKKMQSEYNKLKQEHTTLKKTFETLKPEYEGLIKFKDEVTTKEKMGKIKSEVFSIAKTLKVKEEALGDVFDLVSGKLTLSKDGTVMVDGKETDNDPKEFMESFLKDKAYFIEAPSAPPAKIPPVVDSDKPKQQSQQTSQSNSFFGQSLFRK